MHGLADTIAAVFFPCGVLFRQRYNFVVDWAQGSVEAWPPYLALCQPLAHSALFSSSHLKPTPLMHACV